MSPTRFSGGIIQSINCISSVRGAGDQPQPVAAEQLRKNPAAQLLSNTKPRSPAIRVRRIKSSANHRKGPIALDSPGNYPDLVRRYWRGFLGGFALFAIIGPLLYIFGRRHYAVANSVLAIVLGVGFLWCWVSAVAAWFAILRFRCPRCDKRFALSCWSSWPTSACKHCGLFLG